MCAGEHIGYALPLGYVLTATECSAQDGWGHFYSVTRCVAKVNHVPFVRYAFVRDTVDATTLLVPTAYLRGVPFVVYLYPVPDRTAGLLFIKYIEGEAVSSASTRLTSPLKASVAIAPVHPRARRYILLYC